MQLVFGHSVDVMAWYATMVHICTDSHQRYKEDEVQQHEVG